MDWKELGKLYMQKAKKLDTWRGIVHGIVHTHLMRIDYDKRAIDKILKLAPNLERAKQVCPIPPNQLMGLGFYHTGSVSNTICDKAENSSVVIPAFRNCDRKRLRTMKLEGVDVKGLGWKGTDMTLLDCGCEIPVVDIHLGRYLAKKDPEFLKLLGLKEYDPKMVEKKVRLVQISKNPIRYDKLWEMAKRHAEQEGRPAGEWHVEVWLKERFEHEYPNLTDEQRLELAKNYVRTLMK